MPLMQHGFTAVLCLGLAACGGAPSTVVSPAPPQIAQAAPEDLAVCGGAPYVRLVGQDATALERELILRQVRIVRPGSAVTADFRAERLNFTIDTAGRIARVSCG